MKISDSGRDKILRMIRPGINWFGAECSYDFIVDDMKELELFLSPVDTKEKQVVRISLENFPIRPNKTTRVTLSLSFTSDSRCHLMLKDRGFGEFLGVKVEDKNFTMGNEVFNKNPDYFCTRQKDSKLLVPLNNEVEELSHICVREGQNDLEFYPAVTRYKNKKGGSAVVYSGTPLAEFKYTEGFAFLNETRKKQFIEILKKANALPVYSDGDDEILLRAGVVSDGRMLVIAINLGFDPVDEINLYLEKEPKKITLLMPD
jgi:hypothetical protein